ncbi:MAG: hypothetical protein ACYDHX_05115 [Methanothrix sp.]
MAEFSCDLTPQDPAPDIKALSTFQVLVICRPRVGGTLKKEI